MDRIFNNALSQLKFIVSLLPLKGAKVIDATAGNGKDSLFLAQAVGENGHVYAFDIQEEALSRTRELLLAHGIEWFTLIQDSHEKLDNYQIEKPLVIIFNLGYLPGGDKSIITKPESTLKAIQKGLNMLEVGGVLAVVVYSGHPGGELEEAALLKYFTQLDRQFDVVKFAFLNRNNKPPYLLAVRKTKEV